MSDTNNTLSYTWPSEAPGACVDLKRGRSALSLSMQDLGFLSNLFILILNNTQRTAAAPVENHTGGGKVYAMSDVTTVG
jgi:hypothetical protein